MKIWRGMLLAGIMGALVGLAAGLSINIIRDTLKITALESQLQHLNFDGGGE